ncbi:hypothetical protein [Teichococcus aestuarii]|uniref:hypothetical protein n=1 Tax=Teichococcus aestuarii TaxID=568898 RepID=UPI00361208CD
MGMASGQAGEPLRFQAADGMMLGGHLWSAVQPVPDRSVVVVSPATSVRSRYYGRFAAHLAGAGFDVVTFDYRGIGDPAPPGCAASARTGGTGAS